MQRSDSVFWIFVAVLGILFVGALIGWTLWSAFLYWLGISLFVGLLVGPFLRELRKPPPTGTELEARRLSRQKKDQALAELQQKRFPGRQNTTGRGENKRKAEQTSPPGSQSASIPSSYSAYLASDEWKQRSREARQRAGNRCMLCNRTGPLEVHHRTYTRMGHELPEDLTVLCAQCHTKFHKELGMPIRD